MNWLWYIFWGVLILLPFWLLFLLLRSTKRNQGESHGGGLEKYKSLRLWDLDNG